MTVEQSDVSAPRSVTESERCSHPMVDFLFYPLCRGVSSVGSDVRVFLLYDSDHPECALLDIIGSFTLKIGSEMPSLIHHRKWFGLICKRNANAFSVNAIVDVCPRRRRHEMIFLISRKLQKVATSKSNTAWPSVVFTFAPERTSSASSDQIGSKSHKSVHFGSSSGRNVSTTAQPILKRFTVLETAIQGLHFLLLDIFAP